MAGLEARVEGALRPQGLLEREPDASRDEGLVSLPQGTQVKDAPPRPRRASRPLERLPRKPTEQVVLTRHDIKTASERLGEGRVALDERGENVVADVRARRHVLRVCGVLAPGDSPCLELGAQLGLGALDEGPHHDAAPGAHARKPPDARPRKGAHEEGLRTVVGRVRHQDAARPHGQAALPRQLAGQVPRKLVAHPAGLLLKVHASPEHRRHIHAPGNKPHAQARAQLTHELLVAVGLGTSQAMVHMQHAKALPHKAARPGAVHKVELALSRPHEQRGGVRPPAHHEDEGRGRL